jgi:hypothetical protein
MGTEAVRFLVVWMAGWIHSRQLEVIDFLREETARSASSSISAATAMRERIRLPSRHGVPRDG